jgi:hypothetical protein
MFFFFLKDLSGASSVDGSSLLELLVSLGLLAYTSAPLQGCPKLRKGKNPAPIWIKFQPNKPLRLALYPCRVGESIRLRTTGVIDCLTNALLTPWLPSDRYLNVAYQLSTRKQSWGLSGTTTMHSSESGDILPH